MVRAYLDGRECGYQLTGLQCRSRHFFVGDVNETPKAARGRRVWVHGCEGPAASLQAVDPSGNSQRKNAGPAPQTA